MAATATTSTHVAAAAATGAAKEPARGGATSSHATETQAVGR